MKQRAAKTRPGAFDCKYLNVPYGAKISETCLRFASPIQRRMKQIKPLESLVHAIRGNYHLANPVRALSDVEDYDGNAFPASWAEDKVL
jgi:hypothetical protein